MLKIAASKCKYQRVYVRCTVGSLPKVHFIETCMSPQIRYGKFGAYTISFHTQLVIGKFPLNVSYIFHQDIATYEDYKLLGTNFSFYWPFCSPVL